MSRLRAALAAALLGLGLATPAAATTQRLSYVVYFGFLPALNVATSVGSDAGRYRLEARVVPQSWISWAIPWTANSEASGTLASGTGGVMPEGYRSAATWGTRKRETILDFAADGSLKTTIEPPKVEEGREPVPAEMLKSVLDPVSAVAAMLGAAAAGGPGCAPSVPVFDGRRRFDIHAERQPDAILAPASYSAYAGPAVVCQLRFRSLAGGYRDGERSRFWQTDKPGAERPPIELWLAPLREGALPVPVYVAGKSILGWVTAYLASYSFDPD
ncbi:MAG: DUF3108 domain-containing protein [Rhodospirillaceae bacterium]